MMHCILRLWAPKIREVEIWSGFLPTAIGSKFLFPCDFLSPDINLCFPKT